MSEQKPYGYEVRFTRRKPGTGLLPDLEEVTIRRKGTETAARKAATMHAGFEQIVSVSPISEAEAPPPRKRHCSHEEHDVPPSEPPSGVSLLTPAESDAAAAAVLAVKKIAAELSSIAATKRKKLNELRDRLREIQKAMPEGSEERAGVDKLLAREERLQEHINMEEYESWEITISRVLEAAWKALP